MATRGKGKARTFGQDLMRGEHVVGTSSKRKRESASLDGGLTFGTTMDPYRRPTPPEPDPAHPASEGWQPTGLTFASGTPRRDEVSLKLQETSAGTSIFDPVLCELIYRWFCPPGGLVIDPFAGGSVRGIVASKLGRRYVGLDLRPEQIAANEKQAARICDDVPPRWIVGDSRDLAQHAAGLEADLIFSCPPYGDLERYSDDPADLSTLDYPAFLAAYRTIVAAAVAQLRPDRFACFVVGDIRDRQGFYRGFVRDTEQAFADAGAGLYNEAILVTAVGSLPIRAGKQFEASRKLGKTHQNVLVFCNGDPRRATEAVGVVEFGVGEEEAPPPEVDGDDAVS